MENDTIEKSPGGDSYEMRLLTRTVAEDKDVTLCAAGPQNNSSSHLGPGRCLMLCRCRQLRKGRASSSSSTKTRQGVHEREQLNRMETHHLARSARQVGSTVMNFRDLLLSYLEYTSAHGLPRAARSNSVVRRVLWIGTFAFFVAYFVYQFIALLTMFYNFPVGVKIVIEQKRVIEFPAVTVCNLNIMKVSRISEDPKYRNLGRIDNKIKKQVEHLLSALHLEETKDLHSTIDTSGIDEDDDDTYTRNGEDSAPKKQDQKFPRRDWTPPNGELPDAAQNNRNSTEDTSSNATARGPTGRGVNPARINTTSNDSGTEQTALIDALLLNKRNAEFNHDMSRDLKDFKYLDNNFGAVSNDYEFDQLMSHSMTSDYSDMFDLLKPSSEDLERYGHKAKDFIIQCSMDSRNCSYKDFQRRESIDFGNCYTFNHGSGDSSLILSSKYGSRYGLRLTLNIEHDEYLGLFSQKAGVRVAIHPYNIPPFPEDFGLNASPGSETEIGVTMESVRRLPYPYPTNCTDRKMYHSSMPWDREGLYTVMSCIKSCLQRKMERYCGCVDSEVTSVESIVLRCLSTNSTQEKCRQTVRYLFETNHQGCDCPPPCQEIIYKTTISSTVWPSEPYANLLASALMDENRFFRKSDIFRSIKRNLASIHIYLADMNIKQIDEYPSYPWDRLLADIGGMLGLFVGISACTVMELVEFLFDVILLSFRKCRT